MAYFDNQFFEGEYRDGFFIESMMKRVWAAEIEVLEVIGNICKKHGIKYFADSGTLLGAVRHKGFIPWDDDIDIAMLREDYERFIKVAKDELPEGYIIGEARLNPYWRLEVARVLNGLEIGYENETRLELFHGCPYIVGVDIFVLDKLPVKKEDEILQIQLLQILRGLRVEAGKLDNKITKEMEQVLLQLEQLLKVKIDREAVLDNQCLQLSDRICRMYENDESGEITYYYWMLGHPNYRFRREWYSEILWMPFETIEIPVPIGYDKILKITYGEDYMIPQNVSAGHEYPIYKSQEELLREHKCI